MDDVVDPPTLAVLKKSREILTPPGAWTQHVLARNADGESVSNGCPTAAQFCAIGAVHRAVCLLKVDPLYESRAMQALQRQLFLILMEEELPLRFSVSGYNDLVSKDKVLKLFDKTIAFETEFSAEGN